MSKKRKARAVRPSRPTLVRKSRRMIVKAVVVVALSLCVVAGAVSSLRLGTVRRAVGLAPLSEPLAQATPTPLQLSKEYIYAGGRLVATEEPTPIFAGPPPTNLVATANSITPPSASVSIAWTAPASGTATSYVVERASIVGQFSQVGQPVTAPTTSFNDTSAAEGAAYLYRVKAVFSGDGTSDYSNTDMATAVAFTDDPLQIGVTKVYARHLTELHRAIDAVRVLAGLGAVSWQSNPSPQQGGSILAAHFLELRTNLNPALSALGISQLPTDSTLAMGLAIKATHIQDVRDKVK